MKSRFIAPQIWEAVHMVFTFSFVEMRPDGQFANLNDLGQMTLFPKTQY